MLDTNRTLKYLNTERHWLKSNKTAIIVHGGAIKGAFAAGVMYQLSRIGIKTADILVGTSSSVPTMAYFTSQQFDFMRNIWLNEVGTREFVQYVNLLAGKPVFDLRYLIDVVFRQKYPLDVARIIKSKSLFLIPLYNYQEGRVEFINNQEERMTKNFWKILQAAITVHDQHIVREDGLEQFVDAYLDPFAFYRQEVIPKDYNVIIVINYKELHRTFKRWVGIRIYRLLQSKNFPDGVKDKQKIRGALIESGFRLFEIFEREYEPIIISPSPITKVATITLITRNKDRLNYLFSVGKQSVVDMMDNDQRMKELEIFVSRSKKLSNSKK